MSNYKIVDVNAVIYRGYDIRGVMDVDLNEDVYYTLGRGFATYLSQRRIVDCAVGRDNRNNSDIYAKAFIAGLNEGGINTIDIGLSLSPIVYFSNYELKTKGSVMITASHNPKEYNGLKIGIGYSETMVSKDIIAFKELVASKKFSQGNGENRTQDIFESYKLNLLKCFKLNKKWKIVLDGMNTNSGIFYPQIFEAAGCEVIKVNCDPDGDFPSGAPDPTESKVLEKLAKKVLENNADIGFAFDADGDRMAVVDEKGNTLWMDQIVAIYSKDILEYLPGSQIVFNTLCSKVVSDVIEQSGGKPAMWLTGHSFIKEKIKELNAPFGGELSGHIFFNDSYYGHDDSCFGCLRLLAYLERKNLSMNQESISLPHYISSPEVKLGLADAIKMEFIDTIIRKELMGLIDNPKLTDIDGIRVEDENRMVIIRASQNGPYVTVKFEAKTQEDYQDLKTKLGTMLKAHPEIDWSVGVNIEALG